ncbi:PD-(D/E)XK nuclease-like domain-containing protein [Gilliamella sp. Bif1-4]|uniref:PD-(D/E)XK nuclease-like domain-containing protein n=1 Tax=Gilliamella sp. Bif1-4 TaxID=3120233 RepID=UPI00080E7A81|nr:PD-(D/E)XK nuclease-like domain-containing protein [Gilliamella apicola]OCG39758.1 exodeoxyribonuclease VIII [Gilliamella apicola]
MKQGIYYDISNEDYHNGAGISKSQLDFIEESPALYQWVKNAPVDKSKMSSLDMGTAFHCLLLEPEEFKKRFIIPKPINLRTNAGKAEYQELLKEAKESNQAIITNEDYRKLLLMRDSAMAHPLAKWIIEERGYTESSIYWNDIDTDILCRCRPDKFIEKFNWVADIKTSADIDRFYAHSYDYRYHVQDSFYSDGVQSITGEKPTFVFLVVSTTINCGRYPVKTFILDEAAKNIGRQAYKANLFRFKQCTEDNNFPALQTLSLPYWAKELKNE